MMKLSRSPTAAVITVACLALTACQDSPLAPEPAVPEAAETVESAALAPDDNAALVLSEHRSFAPDAALEAIRDVVERVLPTLEAGGATTATGAGLLQALASLERNDVVTAKGALRAAEQALDRFQRQAGAAFAPDIAAIRLAIEAGL